MDRGQVQKGLIMGKSGWKFMSSEALKEAFGQSGQIQHLARGKATKALEIMGYL